MSRMFLETPQLKTRNFLPLFAGVLCSVFCVLFFYACAAAPRVEDTRRAEAHFKLGASYLSRGEMTEASIEFQKALKLNPEHKESMNYLGYINRRFKKYDDAISYYKRAISVDPDYSDAINNLGAIYIETEEWDEAIKYFKMALSNPFYITPEKAYTNMAIVYYKKEDYQNAEGAVNNALSRNPEFPVAIYIQGLLYLRERNDERAIEKFSRAISIMPDYLEARWELANTYVRVGEREKAVEHFKVIAEKAENTAKGREALEYIELLEK